MDRLAILILLVTFACSADMDFDRNKWNEKGDLYYKYRRQMVMDLLESHLNSEMTEIEITDLVGRSSNYGDSTKQKELTFEIYEDYGWDIDPIEVQHLIIALDNDLTLDKVYLETWKHLHGTERIEFIVK